MEVASQTGRLVVPRGGAARQEALGPADAGTPSASGKAEEAWEVYRTAQKRSGSEWKEEKGPRAGKKQVKGNGQPLNASAFRIGAITGIANLVLGRSAHYAPRPDVSLARDPQRLLRFIDPSLP